MNELIERLQQATGPSVSLNRAIWCALNPDQDPTTYNGDPRWKSYTGSIDAAMTLVPDGAGLQLERYWLRRPEAAWRASLYTGGVPGNPRRQSIGEDAYTPAIALCIAALNIQERGTE